MAADETPKKKSRKEIIQETLATYLKKRNYIEFEKFNKPDFDLTQTKDEFVFNNMIETDLAKVNSFLYSNVICLTNNPSIVDQQFQKFTEYVERLEDEFIKCELNVIFGPLLCHLYIELLKGRDWKAALEFLSKYAHLVATVEDYSAPCHTNVRSVAGQVCDDPSALVPTTQIRFTSESTGNSIRDHFKGIIQTLSYCETLQSLQMKQSIVLLRSSKYKIELHLESLVALKEYLSNEGHVIILNILNTWFDFEIVDLREYEAKNPECLNKCDEEDSSQDEGTDLETQTNLETTTNTNTGKVKKSSREKRTSNPVLKKLRHAASKLQKDDSPARNFAIADQGRGLSTGAIDTLQCHLVAGFNNSLVKIWQLNQSTCPGKNLYRPQYNRHCEWESTNIELDEDECDNIDFEPKTKNRYITGKRYEYDSLNEFDDTGGIALYGHSRGVTDTHFSKFHNMLLTTSKDATMRLWRASTYECAAVYRGHNYPIWCCCESPLGQYAVTGSKDLTARLWALEREFPVLTYVGHTQDVETIAFHPNGNYIATGSSDLSIRLWSVTTGRLFRVFTDCKFPITKVSFSPDGKYLAAGGEELKVRIFDLAGGSQIAEFKEHTSQITDLTWNNNGKILATSCIDGSIRLWDATKIGATESKLSTSKTLWYANHHNRIVKLFFNSMDLISSISRNK